MLAFYCKIEKDSILNKQQRTAVGSVGKFCPN